MNESFTIHPFKAHVTLLIHSQTTIYKNCIRITVHSNASIYYILFKRTHERCNAHTNKLQNKRKHNVITHAQTL